MFPTVVGVNLCLENSDPTGQAAALQLWDYRPTAEDNHHPEHISPWSGYPYGEAELRGRERISVPINSGDLYFVNGRYVHGVANDRSVAVRPRINFSIMLGILNGRELIYWA